MWDISCRRKSKRMQNKIGRIQLKHVNKQKASIRRIKLLYIIILADS